MATSSKSPVPPTLKISAAKHESKEKLTPMPIFALALLPKSDGKSSDLPEEIMAFPPQKFVQKIEKPLALAVSTMIGNDRVYAFRLASVVTISASGTGIVNSVVNCSNVTSAPEFSAFSGIFNEYFVRSMQISFSPVSRYQYPLSGTSTLSVANRAIGVAPLFHGVSAYTSISALMNNRLAKLKRTADPWTFTWVNNENWKAGVTSSSTNQAWVPSSSGVSYNGQIQIISNSAPPALPVSAVLGDICVAYEVLFRARF
jgi:hypothetical protein